MIKNFLIFATLILLTGCSKNFFSKQIVAYDGNKTIAPYKNYTVTKKFGATIDPTYDLHLFNPNITLKPKDSPEVVNILDGKVIYISKDTHIGYIAILENSKTFKVLYAHLDELDPQVKLNTILKKGEPLGVAKKELFLEVIQNGKNIDPESLIE